MNILTRTFFNKLIASRWRCSSSRWRSSYAALLHNDTSCVLVVSQIATMFWLLSLCSDLFILVLSLFAFSALTLTFQFFTPKIACKFQDRGCVILRDFDSRLKIWWSIPCLFPVAQQGRAWWFRSPDGTFWGAASCLVEINFWQYFQLF